MKNNFIVEITKGHWRGGSEDRLTQIIVGSFNASSQFAKVFCNFLGIPHADHLIANSQFAGEDSRADIVIVDKNEICHALIESKTETYSSSKQNKRHESIKSRKYFQITKYPEQLVLSSKWLHLSWTDFAHLLEDKAKRMESVSFEKTLIMGVVEWLREHHFMNNTIFTSNDLKKTFELMSFFQNLEFKSDAKIRGASHFESFTRLNEALEFTIAILRVKLKSDSGFNKLLKGSPRENTILAPAWWIEDFPSTRTKKNAKLEDRWEFQERKFMQLRKMIKIAKTKEADGLYIAVSFGAKDARSIPNPHLLIGLSYRGEWDVLEHIPVKKSLTADELSDRALKTWSKALGINKRRGKNIK